MLSKTKGAMWALWALALVLSVGCGSSSSTPAGMSVTTFKPASIVIGQGNFSSYSSAAQNGRVVAAYTIDDSYGSSSANNGVLYVPDFSANRVLGFNMIPTTNGAGGGFALGQNDLVSSGAGTTSTALNGPGSVRLANGKLFVLDYNNNRVLIYNTPPTTSGAAADVVVGQGNFTSSACTATQSGLCGPDDIFVVGNKLVVADSGNNRVLIWNTIPTTNGASADVVVGQGAFNLSTGNDDNQDGSSDATPSNRTLSYPAGLWSNGTKLVVCDSLNNRVLIWNSIPTSNFAAANTVLGQGDFSHMAYNDDDQDGVSDSTPSARTLNYPYYVESNGTHFFVSDTTNNRVLVWESFPGGNFTAAAKVLGQASFTAGMANDDDQNGVTENKPSSRTLNSPNGLHLYGSKLFVSDQGNHRVLGYDF